MGLFDSLMPLARGAVSTGVGDLIGIGGTFLADKLGLGDKSGSQGASEAAAAVRDAGTKSGQAAYDLWNANDKANIHSNAFQGHEAQNQYRQNVIGQLGQADASAQNSYNQMKNDASSLRSSAGRIGTQALGNARENAARGMGTAMNTAKNMGVTNAAALAGINNQAAQANGQANRQQYSDAMKQDASNVAQAGSLAGGAEGMLDANKNRRFNERNTAYKVDYTDPTSLVNNMVDAGQRSAQSAWSKSGSNALAGLTGLMRSGGAAFAARDFEAGPDEEEEDPPAPPTTQITQAPQISPNNNPIIPNNFVGPMQPGALPTTSTLPNGSTTYGGTNMNNFMAKPMQTSKPFMNPVDIQAGLKANFIDQFGKSYDQMAQDAEDKRQQNYDETPLPDNLIPGTDAYNQGREQWKNNANQLHGWIKDGSLFKILSRGRY